MSTITKKLPALVLLIRLRVSPQHEDVYKIAVNGAASLKKPAYFRKL